MSLGFWVEPPLGLQSESFCYLNLEGLLCLALQTIEALLDFGSKVTQNPVLTSNKKKMAHKHYVNKLTYAIHSDSM